jgi:hypothetical protein
VKRPAAILLGLLIGLASAVGLGQSQLTARDYDDFYSHVILKAKNGNKAEWLASYDPVVDFIARVRRDVEALPGAAVPGGGHPDQIAAVHQHLRAPRAPWAPEGTGRAAASKAAARQTA